MSEFTVTLPGGKLWTPQFVDEINQEKCIGCGRCYKVCGRDVLAMVGINEDGEVVKLSHPEDEDDDEDEYDKKVMSIDNVANCVGCEACAKICPKQCYTHAAVAA